MVGMGLVGCSRVAAIPHPTVLAPVSPKPPASFVQSTADSKTTRTLPVRDGMSKTALFRSATDALSQDHTIDVSDPKAGFLMTTWESGVRDGVPDLRYRTRVVLRFLGDDWKEAQVKAEANWQRGGDEWDVGYDSFLLGGVTELLRSKFGKR